MRNRSNHGQVCITGQMRTLWEQHVYWTRFFIVSTAVGLSDIGAVTDRLLRNPKDFARVLIPFYGAETAGQFEELFTEHLKIGGDLVNAAKNDDSKKADELRRNWYENADEIDCFLASINPFWNSSKWQEMMYSHLNMTEKEAALQLQGDYKASIDMFDSIEQEALMMADYMACGIVRQFSYW